MQYVRYELSAKIGNATEEGLFINPRSPRLEKSRLLTAFTRSFD